VLVGQQKPCKAVPAIVQPSAVDTLSDEGQANKPRSSLGRFVEIKVSSAEDQSVK